MSLDRTAAIVTKSNEVVIRVDVIDTGIGMTKQDTSRAFVPFSQADQSTTKRFGGTGCEYLLLISELYVDNLFPVGLSICRELLTLMGGQISVTSTVGVGSWYSYLVLCFWYLIDSSLCRSFSFQIPAKISQEMPAPLSKQNEEMDEIRRKLTKGPNGMAILACSAFSSTRALLSTILIGFQAQILISIAEVKATLAELERSTSAPTSTLTRSVVIPSVVILDVSIVEVQDIVQVMGGIPSLDSTSIIYLYARTSYNMHQTPNILSANEGNVPRMVLRCSKPLRPLHLLRQMLDACNVQAPSLSSGSDEIDDALPGAHHTNAGPEAHPSTRPSMITASVSKAANNFSDEQLNFFKTVRVLIAEGLFIRPSYLSAGISFQTR